MQFGGIWRIILKIITVVVLNNNDTFKLENGSTLVELFFLVLGVGILLTKLFIYMKP